jgi:pimeloyl-ACP methyl ester carboxylesterase
MNGANMTISMSKKLNHLVCKRHRLHLSNLLMLFCITVISGCATPQYRDDLKHHQLAANTNGNYLSLYEQNDKFQCGLNKHLANIIKGIKRHASAPDSGKKKVLIAIHGGLNGIDDNFDRVKKHAKDAVKDNYYPIFIGWRSGALTTLNDRYFGVRNGIDRPWYITVPSSPFYLASDLLRGIAAIPESLWDQSLNLIDSHANRISGFDEEDIQGRKIDFDDVKFHYTGRGKEKSGWQQVGYATRQVLPGVLRIVSTPLIEGVANQSWGVMLRRAKTLIYRQSDLSYRGTGKHQLNVNAAVQDCEVPPNFEKNGPNGIVAQLMRALRSIEELEVTLVGHSMGAIIANDIVAEFGDLNYGKIIHMASADSVRNLMNKTMPYLKKKKRKTTQFFNLMLHPTNEEQEQSAFGIAPEGSLLIWLDYLLMNPETSLDRRAGRWDNIKWAFPYFKNNSQMHFKLFGLRNDYEYSPFFLNETNKDAAGSEPITHGGFGDFKFWREEFYWGKLDD